MQALQAKLLLTFFAAFGGEAPDFVTATENIGFWAQVSAFLKIILFFNLADT
jgi:hypothetical protein